MFTKFCILTLLQDLSRLGRDIRKVVIVDNSPQSYIFHPDNAVSSGVSCVWSVLMASEAELLFCLP